MTREEVLQEELRKLKDYSMGPGGCIKIVLERGKDLTSNDAKPMLSEVVKCCDNPDERCNKHSDIDIGTDSGHYRDLTFSYCNNCGEVWNIEFE